MEFVEFHPDHMTMLHAQPFQVPEMQLGVNNAHMLRDAGPCWTFFDGSTVIGCLGHITYWPGRVMVWCIMGPAEAHHMRAISKRISNWLKAQAGRLRIEVTVDAEYPQAIRWAELMGFKCETPNGMKNYGPTGRTFLLYSWTQDDDGD